MDLPHLDLVAEGFSTRGEDVYAAREASWCARTPYGYAILRHREAGLLLRDRRLRQGSHAWPDTIGIEGSFADFWRRSIIAKEGAEHTTLRRAAQAALAEDHINTLKPTFTATANALCSSLPNRFDFVSGFSEPFAGRAIAALMGRPVSEAAAIARDAAALGLAMGPEAKRHEATFNAACDRLSLMAQDMIDTSAPFATRLIKAGLSDRQALVDLIVISLFGGVDTTRAQLGFAMILFSKHPEQWTWLRQNRASVPQALDEVIRTRPTTTWASREAQEDFTSQDLHIRAGDTLHVLVHASATDPATGHENTFNIRKPRKIHHGFGGGAHHCLGHYVARTDMAAALNVLLDHWPELHLDGPATLTPDSGNTHVQHLPMRLHRPQSIPG